MRPDPDLRSLFASGSEPLPPIDTSRVIQRSRRRRLPARLAIGGATTLAVLGIVVVGVQGLSSVAPTSSGMSESGVVEEADLYGTESFEGADMMRTPAERLNLCGEPLAEVPPSATGLVLTAAFPEASSGASRVDGTVTLTNTGTVPVSGFTAASPAVTLSSDGVVLWHSNSPTTMVAVAVDLEPGESLEYAASFVPVRCAIEDHAAEAFRPDLPALPPGEYTVTAAIDLQTSDTVELVTGAPTAVLLR